MTESVDSIVQKVKHNRISLMLINYITNTMNFPIFAVAVVVPLEQ